MSALTLSSGEELAARPFADRLPCSVSGGFDDGEFIVSESDGDGVTPRMFAGWSAGARSHVHDFSVHGNLDLGVYGKYGVGMTPFETLAKLIARRNPSNPVWEIRRTGGHTLRLTTANAVNHVLDLDPGARIVWRNDSTRPSTLVGAP
jgi:hypothetical protein